MCEKASPAPESHLKHLPEIHAELSAGMRWRSDMEFKILTVYIAVIAASLALLFQAQDKGSIVRTVASVAVLILTTSYWLIARDKVQKDHQNYARLGGRIVRIWEEWKLFESVDGKVPFYDEEYRKYGQGDGYQKTLRLMLVSWLVSVLAAIVLLVSGMRHCCCSSREKGQQEHQVVGQMSLSTAPTEKPLNTPIPVVTPQ